jgi:hypothetical protein
MEKVIFDTNNMRNIEPKHFLGNRVEIEKFAKVAEIIIPDIVIEEIKNQKVRNLSSKKQSFLSNPFHWMRDIDENATKEFDINKYIEDLELKESIPYQVINLTNFNCVENMKELALKKLPPFENSDKTDKGFKDAYIYFTILEYLQNIDDKYIFVVTNDGLLGEACKKHSNIYVVKNFDEFMQKSISTLYNDYFIEKLQSEIDSNITRDAISDYWISINENHILYIELEGIKYIVEVDSGEIIEYKDADLYKITITNLIESNNYKNTIESIKYLTPYINYFSDEDAIKLLEALVNNSQIRGTLGAGNYTTEFMKILYEKKSQFLTPEIKKEMPDRIK